MTSFDGASGSLEVGCGDRGMGYGVDECEDASTGFPEVGWGDSGLGETGYEDFGDSCIGLLEVVCGDSG